jgi:agmatine/peptidylarginine deiminase
MLTWSHAASDWASQLGAAYATFAQIGAAISQYEALLCICQDAEHHNLVDQYLDKAATNKANLYFAYAQSNDAWARDHGPICALTKNGAILNDFTFDGWGGKYPAGLDTQISQCLHQQNSFANTPMQSHTLVLEGGALETDGQGTLLATRSSVLDKKRNPLLSSKEIENQLQEYLGIQRFLWLDHGGLTGDDTDAHIDVLARFTDPQTIVYSTAPANDADHAALTAMQKQLAEFRTAQGSSYQLIPLPFPGIHTSHDGRRLPASYANFLIINGAVLLPTYQVPQDAEAIAILESCFPNRKIIPIDCRTIIQQNGSLHCLTMQFPKQVTLQQGFTDD